MQTSEAKGQIKGAAGAGCASRASRREPGCSYVEHGLSVRLAVLRVAEPAPIAQEQCPVLSGIASFHRAESWRSRKRCLMRH
jgi:hypothetical protein